MTTIITCVACGEPVGTTADKMVPVRCRPCLEGIRAGVVALQEGRTTPWEDVKSELGLDPGPTVGEVISDAQRFREEIEMDAALKERT